jgi:hypothetical protein
MSLFGGQQSQEIPMPPTDPVAALTRDQLLAEIANLRLLADRLEEFAAGSAGSWTDHDALAGHQLLVRVQSHVAGTRALRAARGRADTLVRLDDRR